MQRCVFNANRRLLSPWQISLFLFLILTGSLICEQVLAIPAACGFSPFKTQSSSLVCVVSAELGQWTLLVVMLAVKPPGHQSGASVAFLEKKVSLVCLLIIFKCRHDLNLQH